MAVILTYAKLKGTNMDIPDRKQRTVPAIAGIIFYIMGYFVVTAIDAPHVLTVLMAAYAVCTMFMTIISLYWKISFHAIGMVGPVMSLAMQYGPFLLLLLLCLFPIGWARYVLRKHTLAQLVAGVSLGFVLMIVVFQLMGPAIF
ncbi:MAG: hypothetical protein MJZ68_00640 [archaeon]|nr:hypothetical protein [archaeon]